MPNENTFVNLKIATKIAIVGMLIIKKGIQKIEVTNKNNALPKKSKATKAKTPMVKY